MGQCIYNAKILKFLKNISTIWNLLILIFGWLLALSINRFVVDHNEPTPAISSQHQLPGISKIDTKTDLHFKGVTLY